MKIYDDGLVYIEPKDVCLDLAGMRAYRTLYHQHVAPLPMRLDEIKDFQVDNVMDFNQGEVYLRRGYTRDGDAVEAGICQCGQGFYRFLGYE